MTDGLVSNTSLIAGVAGGDVSAHNLVLTGLAGLAAGAFSMATGEYISVASQTELTRAEIEIEKAGDRAGARGPRRPSSPRSTAAGASTTSPRARSPASSRATPSRSGGCTPARSSASTRTTCRSPGTAAGSSFVAFSLGALLPLLPYLLGATSLLMPVALGVALFGAGAAVSRFTNRTWLYAGVRQLVLGGLRPPSPTWSAGRSVPAVGS